MSLQILKVDRKFLIPVSLLAENQLEVTVKGGTGSSVNIEIKSNILPQDNNSAPVMADLNLQAIHRRSVSGSFSVSDPDPDQSHVSELLLDSGKTYDSLLSGRISFSGRRFDYEAPVGFKGKEAFFNYR